MELRLGDLAAYYNQDIYAKSAVSFLSSEAGKEEPFRRLFDAKNALCQKHNTSIVVSNAIDFFLYQLASLNIGEEGEKRYVEFLKRINTANEGLAALGAKKIADKSQVFVHSLNNQVCAIIEEASKHKTFTIAALEHYPYMFGRHLSSKLNGKISVKVYPDLLLTNAISDSSLVLLGGEAISDSGVIAKAGSELCCHAAKREGVLAYVCAHSWKYDRKNKMARLVSHQHKDKTHDATNMYEWIDGREFSGVITEHGIFPAKTLSIEIRPYSSWLFV
ncbi:MAG: translation initiation factor eIF-2B [Nanoarchaeota archaeon]|nr:translation initiation factor eIF-2B [Nanoarchaeota archaeon]